MENSEKQISSQIIHQGKILNLRVDQVELQDGRQALREVVEHNGGVSVVPLDSDGCVIAVKQFRYPAGKEIIEIPAGKLERGENPLECAIRELREETGCEADEYIDFGWFYPTPAYCEEKIYIYLAQKLTHGEKQLDDGEFLDNVRIPLKDFVDMITRGEIIDGKTIIGVLKTWMLKNDCENQCK